LLVLAAPALVLTAGCGGDGGGDALDADAPFPRAPIVLISLDTLRADALSGFGAPAGVTPRLTAFAEQSVAFETAIAASHHTAPSHATMLTGYSPFVHGVALGAQRTLWRIPDSMPTLADVLRGAGYATAGFTDGVQLLPGNGFARGFDIYDYRTTTLDGKLDDISAWLDETGEAPFFLFAHTYRPHQPYRAPTDLIMPLIEHYDGVFRQAALRASKLSHSQVMGLGPDRVKDFHARLAGRLAETDRDREFMHELYLAGVTGTDREFGRLLDLLDRHGVLERAIVIVTSDHGEAFFEHGHDSHADVYDEILRVPLLVRLPDGTGASRRVVETFPSVNLMPTLLELVGARRGVRTEGRSVAKVLLGAEMQDQPAFSAWWASPSQWPDGTAVRTRDYKRIEAPPRKHSYAGYRALSPAAFFEIADDPTEQHNLAEQASPEFLRLGEVLADARRRWKVMRTEHSADAQDAAPMTDEQAEALQAIGYMGEDR
jgi:arylsulfatase A-like enzyme